MSWSLVATLTLSLPALVSSKNLRTPLRELGEKV